MRLKILLSLISVDGVNRQCSASPVPLHLGEAGVTLSSYQADTSGCGLPRSPWIIKTPSGQRVNISLVDFGWNAGEETEIARHPCTVYGYVLERSLGMNTTFCGGTSRESHVYLSASSEVEVALVPQTASAFLLTVRSKTFVVYFVT